MKVLVICLISLVAMTNGLQMFEKYPGLMNFSKKRSIMAVMTQVEAHLKANGPLDAITTVLDEFKQAIINEQIAHDQLHEAQAAECASEVAFRKAEIAEATAALTEAQDTLDSCIAQKARAQEDLRISQVQLKETIATLIETHTIRNREKYAFDTATGVYTQTHAAIEEALVIVDQIFSGAASFVQMSRHANKMLLNAIQLRQAHHLAPILSVLAQVATKDIVADEALLNQVVSLFQDYKSKIEAGYAAAVAAENAAIAKYNADVARLEALIASLEQQIEDLKEEIDQLNTCIKVQTNIVNQSNAKIARNSRLLEDAVKMCASMEKNYVAAKAARLAELDLLAAIKQKVDEHYANLAAGVVERGKLDNFDDTYTNESEYHAGVFTPTL